MAIRDITAEAESLRAIEQAAREAWPSLLGYGVLWDDRVAIRNSEVSRPRYLIIAAEAYEIDWSEDNSKALRFARREDASLFASAFLDGNGRIAEHGWETESSAVASPRA